jgi:hypothetical protein
MDIPEEQLRSGREGSLVSLVQQLIDCTDDQEGQGLKTAFYHCFKEKFYDRLKKATSRLYSGIPDWEGRMKEIFNDTFLVAFKEMKTFKMGDGWDDTECQKVILNWMSEIANNLLLKLSRSTKKEKGILKIYKTIQSYDIVSGQELERKTYKQTYDKVKFDKFWGKLNPMAKEILLTCAELGTVNVEAGDYLSDREVELLTLKNELSSSAHPKEVKGLLAKGDYKEQNTNHLPDEVMEYLKSKYNVKPPAIRKAKQRALEGLRNCKT